MLIAVFTPARFLSWVCPGRTFDAECSAMNVHKLSVQTWHRTNLHNPHEFSFESTCPIRIGVFLRYDQTTESLRSVINFPQELQTSIIFCCRWCCWAVRTAEASVLRHGWWPERQVPKCFPGSLLWKDECPAHYSSHWQVSFCADWRMHGWS